VGSLANRKLVSRLLLSHDWQAGPPALFFFFSGNKHFRWNERRNIAISIGLDALSATAIVPDRKPVFKKTGCGALQMNATTAETEIVRWCGTWSPFWSCIRIWRDYSRLSKAEKKKKQKKGTSRAKDPKERPPRLG